MKGDWRLMSQDKYLMEVSLRFHKYSSLSDKWEHEHCDFCSKKIMEDCRGLKFCTDEGYSTLDEYYWICRNCYEDFKMIFKWKIVKG